MDGQSNNDGTKIRIKISDGVTLPPTTALSSSEEDEANEMSDIPSRYHDIYSTLSTAEKDLLIKYARAKKVMLRIAAQPQSSKIVAVAKAAQAQYKKPEELVTKETNSTRRPKMLKRPRVPSPENKDSTEDGIKGNYAESGYLLSGDWNSEEQSEALMLSLPKLSFTNQDEPGRSGNSVVVWATMPEKSERFCFNICPSTSYKESDKDTEIWYHFNPRDGWGRKQVIQNSFRHGTWDKGADKTVGELPMTKGKRFEFRLTLQEHGFCMYIDGVLQTEYPHRFGNETLQEDQILYLVVPVREEHYGDKETVIVHAVWWGHVDPDPGTLIARRSGKTRMKKKERRVYEYEDKVLFVSGLPRDGTAKSELLRLFAHYGMSQNKSGEYIVRAVDAQGFGFVNLEHSKNVDDAIQYLHGVPGKAGTNLSVKRARKTKG